MPPASRLAKWHVPNEQSSGFPFNSPVYESFAADGVRCRDLLDNVIRLSDSSTGSYFEVVNGEAKLYNELDLDDKDIEAAVYERLEDTDASLRVILIPQGDKPSFVKPVHPVNVIGRFPIDEKTRRRAFMISRPAYEGIFKAIPVPPRFLEVMANNNGCYQARTTFADDGALESFRNRTQGIGAALSQMFTANRSEGVRGQFRGASPFQVLNIIVSEYVALMEPERQLLDVRVRELEAKTGMSAHIFDESQKAAADEHNSLLKDLHVLEGLLAFFERTTQFQVDWIMWLQAQHASLNELRLGTCDILAMTPEIRRVEENVASSLSLCTSFSRERLEQVKTLRNRIQIQLSIVANLIAQNDSRTNIAVAEASRRIAFETKRDNALRNGVLYHQFQFRLGLPGELHVVDLSCSDNPTHNAHGRGMAWLAQMG
ncbi:MAG: hypothetical protein Q9219_006859 [cf. Caloplaca sp. 3 TL-2023]